MWSLSCIRGWRSGCAGSTAGGSFIRTLFLLTPFKCIKRFVFLYLVTKIILLVLKSNLQFKAKTHFCCCEVLLFVGICISEKCHNNAVNIVFNSF